MATLFQGALNTTVNGTQAQLAINSGPGWSAAATSLTLTPAPSDTSMPAIYVLQVNPPENYTFGTGDNGGTGFNFGSSATATYGIVSYTDHAYLVAIDGITSGTGGPGSFTLNVYGPNAEKPIILDPAVSFNPPG